jgi:rSAM/selenodomain-associated transferase 2
MGSPSRVSVVVPVLNEAGRIASCLRSLRRFVPPWEVLVVDGGSGDGTGEIAASLAGEGVRTLRAPRGRGPQMNAGARAASGDVLLFLHADVTLPDDAPGWIDAALAEEGVVAGAFRIRTEADAPGSMPGMLLRLADVRSRYTGLPYGDQALFVRAEVFRRVGGFAEIPLMEDLDLARRLRRVGKIRTAPTAVRVSGRRFLARPIRSAFSWSLFPILYRLGVPPGLLARFYGDPR